MSASVGKLILKGRHRLLVDDSTDPKSFARLMGTDKGVEVAECVFTSPPYADLRDYEGEINLSPEHLSQFLGFPAKTFFVNLGLVIRERAIVPYWDAYLKAAADRKLKLLAWNVWDKGNASAPAHQQAMFGLCHEWIFVFGEYRELERTIENNSVGTTAWGVATTREKDGSLTRRRHGKIVEVGTHRQLDSVIPCPPQKNYDADYTGHPAAFPVALPMEYIKASTDIGQLVADPFCGSGTTLIACYRLARRFAGIEISPVYADIAITRFIKQSGRSVVREDGVEWEN